MCWSIILGIAGIIFEFFSVLVIVYELFFPRDYKKWKYKHYEHTGATDREKYERAKKKGLISIILLISGLTLQIIGLLIN